MKLIFNCIALLSLLTLVTGCESLRRAAASGDVKAVRELLASGTDVNENYNGETALVLASIKGNTEVVKLLLDRGASVNASMGYGLTPLFYAVSRGHTDVAKLLLDKGADIDGAIAKFKGLGSDGIAGLALLERLIQKQQPSTKPQLTAQMSTPNQSEQSIKSDVDTPPITSGRINKTAYAIVIGIENYRQSLPKADYAEHDARTVANYLTTTLGYPAENIVTLLNEHALKSDLDKYLEWLKNNIDKNGTVFFYFSGHGAPNPKTGDAYLVPYDGDPAFIEQTGLPLKKLYETLSGLPAKNIIVALDACFSGAGGRSVAAPGSRALVRVERAPTNNLAILTASGENQISSSYKEKRHGVFTYFLLKGIKELLDNDNGSKLLLADLYGYLKPQVERTSRKVYNAEQTPQFIINDENMKKTGLRWQ